MILRRVLSDNSAKFPANYGLERCLLVQTRPRTIILRRVFSDELLILLLRAVLAGIFLEKMFGPDDT